MAQVQRYMRPARYVYDVVECLGHDGQPREVVVADLQKLLQFACGKAPAWLRLLRGAAQTAAGRPLKLVLFWDECRGGNVLNPLPSKKMGMFYVTLAELSPRALLNADSWLPFAVIPSMVVEDVEGGISRVTRAVVARLAGEQPLRVHGDLWLSFQLHAALSDMEGLRQLYSAKGSAGLRPCLLCSNVVKRDSELADADEGLVEVSAWDRRLFTPVTDEALFAVCDAMLRHPPATQKARDRLEKTSGVVIDPNGLLFDPALRRLLPPSRMLLDPLHCYFQGGVASWESAWFISRLTTEADLGLSQIQAAATAVAWTGGATRAGSGTSYRSNLFHTRRWSEDVFRGEVKDLRRALPLLFFLSEQRCAGQGALAAERESFAALMELLPLDLLR